MGLEDYIRGVKNPPKKPEPEVRFYALDIDSYDQISLNKKQLVKEVFNYLSDESFNSATERYERELNEYGFYQSESNSGLRGLVRVLLCYTRGSYDDQCVRIPREKFSKEYNRCVKRGSQRYTSIQLLTHHDIEEGTHYYTDIFFTDDGSCFITSNSAEYIASLTEDQLGNVLARKCIEISEQREKNKQYRKTHPYG